MQDRHIKFSIEMTHKIHEYCQTFQEWPRRFNTPKDEQQIISDKLYKWLQSCHYFSKDKPFIYSGVRNEEGILITDILTELQESYLYPASYNRNNTDYILGIVKSIQKYCNTYNEWPKSIHRPKTPKEIASDNHARWLKASHYQDENEKFKYADLKDNDGKPISETLDELYHRYYEAVETKEEHIISLTNDIIRYCSTYNEWPTGVKYPQGKKDELANTLNSWLHKSRFYHPETFKYTHVNYNSNISVQDLLTLYYATYGFSIRVRQDSYYKTLSEELKDNLIFSLYSNIIKIYQYVYTSYEKYSKCIEQISDIINAYHLAIDMKTILSFLRLSVSKRVEHFLQMYHIYSLANNNDLAYLYHLLYLQAYAEDNSNLSPTPLKRTRTNPQEV